MSRLLFVKEGVAVWSSHLDLMRALMRSFRRAGIDLKHSQGFTPHPELSILMPLSVGVESQCEIAEFTLAEGCDIPAAEIAERMNSVLPAGLHALESYDGGHKAGKLAWLRARLVLEYDGGMQNTECRMQNEGSGSKDRGSENEGERILRFAQNDSLEPVPYGAQNALTRDEECGFLAPLGMTDGNSVVIEAVVAAQNPTLNPLLLVTAIEKYLPEHKPDHVVCRRLEIYDGDGNVFR